MSAESQGGLKSTPHQTLDFENIQPISASDEEIAAMVEGAELPALMAALAALTGDSNLIAADVQHPAKSMSASISPQGGMDEAMQKRARERAAAAIIAYRDSGSPRTIPSDEALVASMQYITRDPRNDYLPLLRNELSLAGDANAPLWEKSKIAPKRNFRVAVVGGGLAGVLAAHRLKQAGVDFTVFEKRKDVGGVWLANTYPGCRLDTPNFAYSYSFAQNSKWSCQFSGQEEIWQYIRSVAETAGILENIVFDTEVLGLQFDKGTNWTVTWQTGTAPEQSACFDAVITAVGQLDRPSIPEIPGLQSFAGEAFHSATWPAGIDITGKRVAVVGTGASAFQIVPNIVDQVGRLLVVQRNPPWMLPTPNYHEKINTGMAWLLSHIPTYGRWYRFWQFWIAAEGRLPLTEVESDWEHPVSVSRANERLRQECVEYLHQQYASRPDLADAMTPSYPPGAKRMLRDNGVWAKALMSPQTRLVSGSIERIEGSTVHFTDGTTEDVDVIVFATGFQASQYLEPMRVEGEGGRDLHKEWNGNARAYRGITVPGYPNLFMMAGPNTGVVVNGSAIFQMECAMSYVLDAIRLLLETNSAAIDTRVDAFERYNAYVDAGNLQRAWGIERVNSWYKNKFGRASQTWPYTLLDYWSLTRSVESSDHELITLG